MILLLGLDDLLNKASILFEFDDIEIEVLLGALGWFGFSLAGGERGAFHDLIGLSKSGYEIWMIELL